jgi:hypothetical protein
MYTKPSIFIKYRLWAHNAYKNPICMFLSELILEPISTIPFDVQLLTQSPKLHHNQTAVTIVKVKDLRKTISIEKDVRKTNAWLEWIKYSILTLNKTRLVGMCIRETRTPCCPLSPGIDHKRWCIGIYGFPLPRQDNHVAIGLAGPCHYCSPWLMNLKG